MKYQIIRDEPARDAIGNHNYRIYREGRFVASYWHDFRGDEHGIEFANGTSDPWPVGRMIDFIVGGGPQPLVLSARAVAYLDQKLG